MEGRLPFFTVISAQKPGSPYAATQQCLPHLCSSWRHLCVMNIPSHSQPAVLNNAKSTPDIPLIWVPNFITAFLLKKKTVKKLTLWSGTDVGGVREKVHLMTDTVLRDARAAELVEDVHPEHICLRYCFQDKSIKQKEKYQMYQGNHSFAWHPRAF